MNNIINFVLQAMSGNANPNQVIQQMIQQNPQAQPFINQMQQSGMNPKDFVLQFARQNNIDLSPIISQLNQRGIKL
jgi:hypothetical protein